LRGSWTFDTFPKLERFVFDLASSVFVVVDELVPGKLGSDGQDTHEVEPPESAGGGVAVFAFALESLPPNGIHEVILDSPCAAAHTPQQPATQIIPISLRVAYRIAFEPPEKTRFARGSDARVGSVRQRRRRTVPKTP